MAERRREGKRQRRRLTIRFRAAGSNDDFRSGFSDDVSPQGMFVQTACCLPRQARVELEVELAGGSQRLLGIVSWARRAPARLSGRKRSGMGVRLQPGQPGLDRLVE